MGRLRSGSSASATRTAASSREGRSARSISSVRCHLSPITTTRTKTAESRHREHENWSTVGDLGYLDADGYLFLTDRKSFMIISGGVNIYPQEIENVLALHPKVFDVAVIGLPDAEMGEQVKAVIQPRPGIEGSDELAAELIAYVRDRLAHFKAPVQWTSSTSYPDQPQGNSSNARYETNIWRHAHDRRSRRADVDSSL